MWSKFFKSKVTLAIAIVLLVLALLGGAAAYVYLEYWVPYRDAENTMHPGELLQIQEQPDGKLLLQWPEGNNADGYVLDILRPETVGTENESIFYSYETPDRSCYLPELPEGKLTLRIRSFAGYRDERRYGEGEILVTTELIVPRISELAWTADPDTDLVQVSFQLGKNETCQMYMHDESGEKVLLESLQEGAAELAFGEDAAYPVPPYESQYTVTFDVYREEPGLVFYAQPYGEFSLCREDFLGTVLNLKCEDLRNNAYQLTWNETKGEHYEVQQLVKEQWQTVEVFARDAELTYHTGHLAKFRDFAFRVIAVGGQVETGDAIESEQVQMTTGASCVYSTIWPIKKLEVYADTDRKEILGEAPAAKAYCVADEKDGLFLIRYENTMGYIDSNYCMINLPEYMEDLCLYEITNSHHSVFMVNEYEIPTITDTVIEGYEKVELSKGKYLVPLLYPTAQKLVQAGFAAKELGYQIKIYDSFRPKKATTAIYEVTEKILNDPIPEFTFKEKQEMIKNGTWVEPTVPPTEPSTQPPETVPGETTVPEVTEPIETYLIRMTDNGRYALANFLAKGYSNHNLGVALDLTLVNRYTGEEVKMQTSIHDLSWNSELKLNNDDAKRLQRIMVGAGFATLKSEWWHFQDDDAKSELKLPALMVGVNAQCWMCDDNGWRYRRSDGTYYINCRKIIDGVTYHFDANGYVEE